MGKIDDMRRLREQQFADGRKRQTTPRATEPAEPKAAAPKAAAPKAAEPAAVTAKAVDEARGDAEPPQPTRPTRAKPTKKSSAAKSGGDEATQGKCSVCGKMKPLSNGMLASHQKGFGKACAGSRKSPV